MIMGKPKGKRKTNPKDGIPLDTKENVLQAIGMINKMGKK